MLRPSFWIGLAGFTVKSLLFNLESTPILYVTTIPTTDASHRGRCHMMNTIDANWSQLSESKTMHPGTVHVRQPSFNSDEHSTEPADIKFQAKTFNFIGLGGNFIQFQARAPSFLAQDDPTWLDQVGCKQSEQLPLFPPSVQLAELLLPLLPDSDPRLLLPLRPGNKNWR